MTAEHVIFKSLREIEGKISPHQGQLERALKARAEALEYVRDVSALAEFIGGKIDDSKHRGDWAIVKEIFPGVNVHFIFNRADSEFPTNLRALFSGDRLDLLSGEDLVGYVIPMVSHMLRHVRQTNPDTKLPEVVYRV
jgi:hypothetical protein